MTKQNRNIVAAMMIALALTLAASQTAPAAVVPFTEHFPGGPADWRQADQLTDLNWLAAGGPDGSSYASGAFSFVDQGPGARPAILRAHDEFGPSGSSNGAFVGNWLADGVTGFAAWVRHDAPAPLNFFARYANPNNSPAAASLEFVPVLPNTWTELTFDIAFGTPNLFLEGPPTPQFYNQIFSDIGHVQIGAEVPDVLAGNPLTFTFDIDQVRLIPEPAAASLVACAVMLLCVRRKPRSSAR